MEMLPANLQTHQAPPDFPDAASLAALRAWYEGLSARDAVVRYLGERKASGQSARGILGHIRRQLSEFARRRQRHDVAALFEHGATERVALAGIRAHVSDSRRNLPRPSIVATQRCAPVQAQLEQEMRKAPSGESRGAQGRDQGSPDSTGGPT